MDKYSTQIHCFTQQVGTFSCEESEKTMYYSHAPCSDLYRHSVSRILYLLFLFFIFFSSLSLSGYLVDDLYYNTYT